MAAAFGVFNHFNVRLFEWKRGKVNVGCLLSYALQLSTSSKIDFGGICFVFRCFFCGGGGLPGW